LEGLEELCRCEGLGESGSDGYEVETWSDNLVDSRDTQVATGDDVAEYDVLLA
jgi:hypothetical protein